MLKKTLAVIILSFSLLACHKANNTQTIDVTPEQAKALYDLGGTTALGKKSAPITLVEIFSYDCRYCKEDYPLIEQFAKMHPNVRVVFKPFKAFGEKTKVIAQYAALTAGQQGQFLAMHKLLMTTNRPLTIALIDRAAKELHLNMQKFHADLYSTQTIKQIEDNTTLMDDLNIAAIPAIIMTQTALANHPENASTTPQYIQVGFLSNDILLEMMNKVEADMKNPA